MFTGNMGLNRHLDAIVEVLGVFRRWAAAPDLGGACCEGHGSPADGNLCLTVALSRP